MTKIKVLIRINYFKMSDYFGGVTFKENNEKLTNSGLELSTMELKRLRTLATHIFKVIVDI